MLKKLFINLLFLVAIFSGLYYIRSGVIFPQGQYLFLLFLIIALHSFAYFYYRKYAMFEHRIMTALQAVIWSHALTSFTAIFIVSVTQMRIISRGFLLQAMIIPVVLEILYVLIRIRNSNGKHDEEEELAPPSTMLRKPGPIWHLGLGLILILTSFLLISYIKYDHLVISNQTEEILFLLFGSWLVSLFFTRKYDPANSPNIYFVLSSNIKAAIILITLIGVPYFFFRLEAISRFLLFGTAILASLLEIAFAIILHLIRKSRQRSISAEDMLFDELGDPIQETLDLSSSDSNIYEENKDLWDGLVGQFHTMDQLQLKSFLNDNSANIKYHYEDLSVLSSSSAESIRLIRRNSLKALFNFHVLNDQRRMNEYLIACHEAIQDGGLLFGVFEPLVSSRKRIQKEVPRIIFLMYYPIHFLFFRVFPKVPGLDEIYFAITKGRNRVVSKAEVFGRLSYCGFTVVAENSPNGLLYFAARKEKTICNELNPSYHAVVGLKRVGTINNPLIIYKFRTMHPYSEFIQEYVYKHLQLDDKGKFKNDFRLTNWGKVFRRYWIDELPQLVNWLRGDIKLVGVRALSHHYYSLYPDDIKKLRVKTKPGLIPPFYADLPNSFEEILASERHYLQRSLKHPLWTDVIYFVKAFRNILLRGSRSK